MSSIYGPHRAKKKLSDGSTVDLSGYVKKTGTRMTGRINMGNKKITDLQDPTDPQDAATAQFVSNYATHLNDIKLDKTGGSLTGDLSMSSNKITNLADPTNNKDGVTKEYVDAQVRHEHDVALHAIGRYIVIPNEEDGTKSYSPSELKKT